MRNQIKEVLRHFGHAMVSTIHDRLNGVDEELRSLRTQTADVTEAQKVFVNQIRSVETQVNALAAQSAEEGETQNALLQSEIHIIERLRQMQAEVEQLVDGQRQHMQQLCRETGALSQLRKELFSQLSTQLELARSSLHEIGERSGQLSQQIRGVETYTQKVFDRDLLRQVCVETSDYGVINPETGLMEYLYSFLPSRKALDIGAHVGDVSVRLLKTGYEVFAFEPYAPSYQKLTERFANEPRFHAHNIAIGSVEGEMPLHLAEDRSAANIYEDATVFNSLAAHAMPGDLPFVNTVLVTVKDLAGLHRAGRLPGDIGLVKIDTEGYDLEVIRGMGEFRYPVVLAEFWDREIPFGKSGLLYTVDGLVEQMRARGYGWHIVIYRIWGQNQRAFYCNHDRAVPGSWGNLVFFQNFDLFTQAQTWCSAVLPRTFFRPAPIQ